MCLKEKFSQRQLRRCSPRLPRRNARVGPRPGSPRQGEPDPSFAPLLLVKRPTFPAVPTRTGLAFRRALQWQRGGPYRLSALQSAASPETSGKRHMACGMCLMCLDCLESREAQRWWRLRRSVQKATEVTRPSQAETEAPKHGRRGCREQDC